MVSKFRNLATLCSLVLGLSINDCGKGPTNNNQEPNNPPNTYINTLATDYGTDITLIRGSATDPDGDNITRYDFHIDSFPIITYQGGDFEITYSDIDPGNHTFYLTAFDEHGLPDPTPAIRQFTILDDLPQDNINPNTTITSGPANNSTIDENNASFWWTGSDNHDSLDQLVFSYSLSEYGQNPVWSSWTNAISRGYNNLGEDKTYTFQVKAKDQAGNIDQSPASRTFTVDAIPNDPIEQYLTFINSFEIPLEGNGPLEAITIGKYGGNLVTIGADNNFGDNIDAIVRIHSPTQPTSFIKYNLNLPENFYVVESIAYGGNNYWTSNASYYAHTCLLNSEDPEIIDRSGAMGNLVSDICYGNYNGQSAIFQLIGNGIYGLSIYSTVFQGEGNLFEPLGGISGENAPWQYVEGIYYSNNKFYSISNKKGDQAQNIKLYEHNPSNNFSIVNEWLFPGGGSAATTGLAINGNKVYTTTPSAIHIYEFPN